MVQPIRRLALRSHASSSWKQACRLRSYGYKRLPGPNNHFPARISCSLSPPSFRVLLSGLSRDQRCLASSRWLESAAWDAELGRLSSALLKALSPDELWYLRLAVFPFLQYPPLMSERPKSRLVYSRTRSSAS